MAKRLVWLSFASEEKFLGVSVVEIDAIDIAEADAMIAQHYPDARPDAGIIAAAVRKAHQLGCNPGGSVLAMDINDKIPPDCIGRLMQREEIIERGLGELRED